MKNHIIFKFIAILLCAAALLGAVAAGGGILVLMEAELYEKDVNRAYLDMLESKAGGYASEVAVRYASRELGGANEALMDQQYGYYWYDGSFDSNRTGFMITDEDGEILQDQSLAEGQKAEYTFTVPASGRYMKVHYTLTEEEYFGTVKLPEATSTDNALGHVYDAIPEGGAEIYYIEMRFADGSTENIGSPEEYLGVLYATPEGAAEFFGAEGVNLLEGGQDTHHTYMAFWTRDGQLVYEIQSESGILDGWYRDNMTYLLLRDLTSEVFLHDAIPPGGCAVTNIYVEYADGFAESVGGSPEIGVLCYDEEGNVCFFPHDSGVVDYNNNRVVNIQFHDEDSLIYEARDPEGVGYFFQKNGGYYFRAATDIVPEDLADDATVPPDENGTVLSDQVPVLPSQGAKVYRAEIWSPSVGTVIKVESDTGALGEVFVDSNGFVVFRCEGIFDSGFDTNFIRLVGENGQLLFEAYDRSVEAGKGGAVGKFVYDQDGKLIFTTDLNYGLAVIAEGMFVEDPEKTFRAEIQKKVEALDTPNGESNGRTFSKGEIVSVIETEIAEGVQWARTEQGWIPMDNLIRVETPVMEFEVEIIEDATEATEATVPETADATEVTEPVTTEPSVTLPEGFDTEGMEVAAFYDDSTGQQMYALYTYEPMPVLFVEVQLAEGAFRYENDWALVRLLYSVKDQLPILLAVSLLLFAVLGVYLCCAAGKRPGTLEIRAGGLNAMPLELHAALSACGVAVLAVLGYEGCTYFIRRDIQIAAFCGLFCGYGASLLIVSFCFACAAQFKTPGGFWWRNSLTGYGIRLCGMACRWLLKFANWITGICERKLWPWLVKLCKGIGKLVKAMLTLAGRWLLAVAEWAQKWGDKQGRRLGRFFALLPLTWQWLLAGGSMIFFLFITVAGRYDTGIILSVLFAIALVMYGAHCFGTLLESARKMSKGDLEEKVDDKLMVGSFKDFAAELNGLADVAVVAAQKQLKSERMKTELITNVSHDIKTPLTSIINYVDLLQKPHDPKDAEKYLEVLDRQSQRLKKLIDDLMEMSKASTGNMSVDIRRVDAAEAVNQALGEFADKLEKARLDPVFRHPEEAVYMMADGRLTWRVMSNLLSNAVKYALPGTRLYVDLAKVEGKVILSLKNISREELNVEADELLERFVRGDASRNTEGSGLGLNIAKSLMELQKGQLQILVDGDLFKVTLIFPAE